MKKIIFSFFILALTSNFSYSNLDDGFIRSEFDIIPITCDVVSNYGFKNSSLVRTLTKFRNIYGNINDVLSGISNLSDETEKKIKNILSEINYKKEINVKRLHGLGRLYKGKNNILITNSGSLLVSEDWFNSLTYDEQKFIIAQRISQLENYHNILRYFIGLGSRKIYEQRFTYVDGLNFITSYGPITRALWSFFELSCRRTLSSDADILACQKIGNSHGAKKFFQRRLSYEHDGSLLGRIQMFKERARDLVGCTPLYYFFRANELNDSRIQNL